MDKKGAIFAPLFHKYFSATIVESKKVDTDQLGTFSGEVKRNRDLRSVLRKKAMLGLEETELSFGIASEGSFGPHPSVPFIECNRETLIFIGLERDSEVFSHVISTENKAEYIEAENIDQIKTFLKRIHFGYQGVIVKPSHDYVESSDFIQDLRKLDETHVKIRLTKLVFDVIVKQVLLEGIDRGSELLG